MKLFTSIALAMGMAILIKILLPPTTSDKEALAFFSSTQCLDCHPGVAAEWQDSHHGMAFTNPEVKKLSNDFANQECITCHAPQPVLNFEPGQRVLARQSQRALGVDCLSCHITPEGGVATSNRNPNKNAPCNPQFIERVGSVELCAPCHNQHKTVDQWRGAPDNLKGNDCLWCHMEPVYRQGGRQGKNHLFPAGHHLEAVQKAVKLDLVFTNDECYTELHNIGAGHNFPTDERSRAADLQVRYFNNYTWSNWEQLYRFRDPYRDETDLTNTQLPSGESARFELDSNNMEIEVRLLYKTNPFMEDQDAMLVYKIQKKAP